MSTTVTAASFQIRQTAARTGPWFIAGVVEAHPTFEQYEGALAVPF